MSVGDVSSRAYGVLKPHGPTRVVVVEFVDASGYDLVTNQTVDGLDIIDGFQLEQFLPENGGSTTLKGQQVHDGENFPTTKDQVDIRLALIDILFPEVDHLGFREGTGSSDRVDNHYDCDTSPCTTVADPSEAQEGTHATQMLGQLMGDVRDEQEGEPGVPDGLDPEQQRSGVAGEAKAYAYKATTSAGIQRALDHIVALSGTQPSIVPMQIGVINADSDCSGDDGPAQDANDLYEDDKLMFFAAGNEGGSGSSTNCNVQQPGAAIAVFTIGSRGSIGDAGTESSVRTAAISSASNWGGNATEGQGRTIIDMAPYGCRSMLFDAAGGYTDAACGTSQASPMFAGSMIAYMDWYLNQDGWTDLRTEPGMLFANALLMGDRKSGSSQFLTSEFHNRYGAGAVEMRRFDAYGMDSPWGFASGSTCVDDGEVVTIAVNGGATLSSAVNDLKAVAWWYDFRNQFSVYGNAVDDIDLALYQTTAQADAGQADGGGGSPLRRKLVRLDGQRFRTSARHVSGVVPVQR